MSRCSVPYDMLRPVQRANSSLENVNGRKR